MKIIINFITGFLKIILSIINIFLILIIVLNVLLLLSNLVVKNSYPTILDYTYLTVKKNDSELNLKNGDLLIIDSRKAFEMNNIVMFQDNNTAKPGKVIDIKEGNIIIKSNEKELPVNKTAIIGPMIVNIPKIGSIIEQILKPMILIIAIVILIITSLLQKLLNKKIKKDNQAKPDFKQMKNI